MARAFEMNTATDEELAAEIDRLAQLELAIHEEKRPLIKEAERRAVAAETLRKYNLMSDSEKAALAQVIATAGIAAPADQR